MCRGEEGSGKGKEEGGGEGRREEVVKDGGQGKQNVVVMHVSCAVPLATNKRLVPAGGLQTRDVSDHM